MQWRSKKDGTHFPVSKKPSVNMQHLKGQRKAWNRTISKKQKAKLRTLENELLYQNFLKKMQALNEEFDEAYIDRTLEPEEMLFELKKKYPHLDIGLKEKEHSEGFREFLDQMGIENERMQNLIAMQNNPLSEEELAQLSYVMNMRSEHAKKVDKALKAPLTNDVRRWAAHPERLDIKTVDQ